MPLVTDGSTPAANAPIAQLPTAAPVQTSAQPSTLDVAAAAERQSNVVSMLYDRFIANPKPSTPAVPGFDPIASVPDGYENYADRFLDSTSPQETQWIKGRINDELADRRTIARAGGWGVAASIAAGSTDPLTIASMAIPVGGATRLIQAGRLATVAAGTTAAQEVVAQSLSPVRSWEESLTNVGTSAILGGILGSVIRPKVPAAEFQALKERTDATAPPAVNTSGESTAGAAAVAVPSLEENTIAGVGDAIAKSPVGQVAPGLRVLTSPSTEARELVQQLTETREILNKNLEGVATPTAVETVLRGYEGDWYQAWKARGDAFRDYRERIANTDEAPLSRREFGEAVSDAMRRDDQHTIPEVADAAAKTRTIVFDPLKERAQALGLLPEDLKTTGAMSYLTRQYDTQKIKANYSQWLDTLTEGFRSQGVDQAEARDIAYQATRNVLGSERGMMDWKVLDEIVPKSGRLKERTIQLPDNVLEPYLVNDIDHLSHSYLRSLAPEVEMTERFGNRDLTPQLEKIRDEYSRLMEQNRGDDAALTALDKRRDADISDIQGIRDRLYGIKGQPKDPGSFFVRAGRMLRADNALRLLGVATVSHFPDIANVIMKYGLPNTMAALGKLGTSLKAINVTRAEARRMGVGLDMTMNMTAALLGDYGSHSRFLEQRIMAKVTRGFTIATGETPLITAIQSLASVLGSDGMIRTAEEAAAGSLPQRAMVRLAASGIDADMLARIGKEAAAHGQEVNGLKFGMSDKWTDQGAAQAFESAILKDAHAMTLSPGAGDTPFLMSSELGKTLLQFKSFAFAASRHVLMPLAQGIPAGDVRAMSGLLSLVSAGYMSYVTKQWLAGQPIEAENPKRLAMEVLDKSNLLGWTGEAIYPALWYMGFKDFSRWSDRDPVETLGGPSAGTIASVYERRFGSKAAAPLRNATEETNKKGFSRSDLHFVRRLMPAQNLWYMRRAVNNLEDSIGNLFDLPGESNATRQEALAANQ